MAAVLHTFMDIFDVKFQVDDKKVQLKKIVIPIIQRDYAQGRMDEEAVRVRNRFLDSLYYAINEKPIVLDFIYGDIDKNGIMTPLDGQQRLTTLFLLYWYAAKKEKVGIEKYGFLQHFSYETRYSARDFCSYLIKFEPEFCGKLSEEIIDQAWFPLDWKKDPTVHSMLVMLDAIHLKFENVDNLWEKLMNHAVSFYFLPIRDMGLTDELYIKMNSRGKLLTPFEHFKAEWEHELNKMDEETSKRILKKIDLTWTDMLWQYRGKDNTIDDAFLRYFHFVCDIICYKNGGTLQGKRSSEFDLLKEYFSADGRTVLENIKMVENYFDVWCLENLKETPKDFFERFISVIHQPGKIQFDSKIDILEDCLHNYVDTYGNRSRTFPLNKTILLYAVVTYLVNKERITEQQFRRRLRIVYNLTRNSDYEISDSEQRTSGNRIPAILRQVDSIIIKGIVDTKIENNFNSFQLSEEREKLRWTDEHPKDAEALFVLEDHRLLFGQIGIIGISDSKLFVRFSNLFQCSLDAVDCAMIALTDYSQIDRNGWRYQLGSSDIEKAWTNLFHNSTASRIENTKSTLRSILLKRENFTDDFLYQMGMNYVADCEEKNCYDWRYYYLKYRDVFRPGRYGKYWWPDQENAPYELVVLWAELYISQNAYQPFLKLLDENALSREDFGRSLDLGDKWIECENNAYVVYDADTEDEIERLTISQNEDGIDTEERVVKATKWYKKFQPGG